MKYGKTFPKQSPFKVLICKVDSVLDYTEYIINPNLTSLNYILKS